MVPLNEKTYALIDALEKIAEAHRSTVARVALAWVRLQSGVTSTIIGARHVSQLEDNIESTEITLSAEELAHLDTLTKPTLPFPQSMLPILPALHNGGTTINGIAGGPSMIMKPGDKPY
jgi:diketogulonate reductase-like aldo/keto reductase